MRFVILNIVGLVVFGMSAYYTMKNLKRKAWDIAMLSFGMCLVLAPVNVLALVAAACDWTGTRLPLPIESFFRYIFDMDLSRSSAHFGLVIPERMQVVSVSSFVLTVLLSKKDVNDLLTGKVYFDISSEGLENMPDDMKDTYEYKIMEQVPPGGLSGDFPFCWRFPFDLVGRAVCPKDTGKIRQALQLRANTGQNQRGGRNGLRYHQDGRCISRCRYSGRTCRCIDTKRLQEYAVLQDVRLMFGKSKQCDFAIVM